MEIAAGIEYWTAAHARTTKWAKVKPQSKAVAQRIGKPFNAWVGDSAKWSDIFWGEYNALKHQPNHIVDHRKIHYLGESAAVLLTCTLLKRVTGSKVIAERILDSHRLNSAGSEIREIVATSQVSRSSRR